MSLRNTPLKSTMPTFCLAQKQHKLGSCNEIGKACPSQAKRAQDTALLQEQQGPQMV